MAFDEGSLDRLIEEPPDVQPSGMHQSRALRETSMPAFAIDTAPECSGTVVIRGEIDLANAARVDAALAACVGDLRVVCSGVTFIDSAGFHAFDRAHKIAMRRGSVFAVAALPAFPARIGNLLGLQYLEPPRKHSNAQQFGSALEGGART